MRAAPLPNRLVGVRKTTASFAALALSALALTGCTTAPDGDGSDCVRDSSSALESSLEATGDIGAPRVRVAAPIPTSEVIYQDLVVGDGARIREDEQFMVGTLTLLNGDTGAMVDTGAGVWSPSSLSTQFGGAGAALECATQGSRIAFAVPASELPDGMAAQIGLGRGSSLVGTIDVQEVLRPRADGGLVFSDKQGLPSVVRAPGGEPGIIIPDSAAPTKVVAQTLIEGGGPTVGDGRAMFHYTAVNWATRTATGTSWDGNVLLDRSTLPEEVMAEMAKATVGSQLLVVVPRDAGDAVVYVVDVLGIVPPELIQG